MNKMKLPPAPPPDALKFCQFVTASPTPFQAVHNLSKRLLGSGFKRISERSATPASLSAGGKYFYTRNQSSIVAFTLPHKPTPATAVSFAVGHLDSPCLKIRPVSKKTKVGYLQVGVELYGGGIWATWFDRDLSIAGRVIVSTPGANGDGEGEGRGFTSKLVKIDRPLLRIPTLAIHLDRTINDSWKFNKETEFAPILGLVAETLNAPAAASGAGAGANGTAAEEAKVPFSGRNTPAPAGDAGAKDDADVAGMGGKHHPLLLAVLADELGCEIGDIQDFELSLYDTQPSTVGGVSNEFIFSPRMDNLMTCFATTEAICNAVESPTAHEETNVRCVILFDNEEVGSISHHGAESNLLPSFVERLCSIPEYGSIGHHTLLANSFLISADMGHAVNPNFEGKYESNHAPRMNQGPIIKTNANQRYTSNAQTTFLLRRIAKKGGVPLQEFEVRNDSSCGSTVGPGLSRNVRTVDIGLAQLSMHSCRETGGSHDVKHYIKLFQTFFDGFGELDRDLRIDEA